MSTRPRECSSTTTASRRRSTILQPLVLAVVLDHSPSLSGTVHWDFPSNAQRASTSRVFWTRWAHELLPRNVTRPKGVDGSLYLLVSSQRLFKLFPTVQTLSVRDGRVRDDKSKKGYKKATKKPWSGQMTVKRGRAGDGSRPGQRLIGRGHPGVADLRAMEYRRRPRAAIASHDDCCVMLSL